MKAENILPNKKLYQIRKADERKWREILRERSELKTFNLISNNEKNQKGTQKIRQRNTKKSN